MAVAPPLAGVAGLGVSYLGLGESNSSQTVLKWSKPGGNLSAYGRVQAIRLAREPGYTYSIHRQSGQARAEEDDRQTIRCSFGTVRSPIYQFPVNAADRAWFPPVLVHGATLGPASRFTTVALPYWTLVLAYLLLWAGALLWRGRYPRKYTL